MKFKPGVSKQDSKTNRKQQQLKSPSPPLQKTDQIQRVQDQNDMDPLESKAGSLEANGEILSKPRGKIIPNLEFCTD